MKKILGLDLGTTSIGWALVNEAGSENEKSSIIKTGVRVIPYGDNLKKKNPQSGKLSDIKNIEEDFKLGQGISPNAGRTQKRGARRNLQRYKQRRSHLIALLKRCNLINENTVLTEAGKNTTFSIWELRAKAAKEQISFDDLARVLLAINKKRGYKSNRKAKDEGDGQAVDGMEIAKLLYERNLTPGQFVYQRLMENKKSIPDFYSSDLQKEFDKVFEVQSTFYPEYFTAELKAELIGKKRDAVWAICAKAFKENGFEIVGSKRHGNVAEQKIENYAWRVKGLSEKLELEQIVVVFQQINIQINNSSGYLGAISDRSKELYFNNQTVGQYLCKQIINNPHTPLKKQVFYRQDYLDEFERIWEVQAQSRKDILTDELKDEIKNTIIFYQRKLKSNKGLISVCELEGWEIEVEKDGRKKKKIIGPKAIPKSSPLFQEFKIWQILNNLKFENTETREIIPISELDKDLEIRSRMFEELNIRGKLSVIEVMKKAVGGNYKSWEAKNFKEIQGNNTFASLMGAYAKIVELSGHEVSKSKPVESIKDVFEMLGINTEILEFDTDLEGKEFEQQASYQLWHLLYSYEGDDSESGNEKLYEILKRKFGFEKVYAKILASIAFIDDYGSLSAKAIKKILPLMKKGKEYSQACDEVGYRHSHFVSKEENEKRELEDKMELLPKNSLRNPVVEKILNQMVNVVNAVIDHYGKPDEVRIELARELKKSAKERAEMTSNISKATREHDEIHDTIRELYPFNTGVRITRNDILKYKLYKELAFNGHHTLYTNTYIEREKLFSKEFDIEHIIPQATLFDDSFSNKTLAIRQVNLEKGNKTAYDYLIERFGGEESEKFMDYLDRVEKFLSQDKQKNKAKHKKLLMKVSDIPDGFIDRDLRNTQYIAKKSQEMLRRVVRSVVPTTGSITDKLREDWQLINVLRELNWDKYNKLGLTEYETNKDGKKIPIIKDWTKRNDHRHHAMDALAVAFTKRSHVQYFNYLNARRDENHKKHTSIYGIEQKVTFVNDKGNRLIKPPIPLEQFREEAKKHLQNTLVSFKAKNKVVTRNVNKTKKKHGENSEIELTPRGQLHKETVYGKSAFYQTTEIKVGTKCDLETINKVAKKSHREALLKRLQEYDNDPEKAFGGKNSPAKNPIYLDEHQAVKLPEKVVLVWQEDRYTIRKDISPDNFKTEKNIEKIIDIGQRDLLLERLRKFDGNANEAFSNLDEVPIWLVKPSEKSIWKDKDHPRLHELGIPLKRVTITGVSNAEPLHTKKDHFGNEILDENGKPMPVDFVSTGNNHHVAIYKDDNGDLFDYAVSFFDVVKRQNYKLPIVPKDTNLLWDKVVELGIDDQVFLRTLPQQGLKLVFSMKQNEYFVFPTTGFNPQELDLTNPDIANDISPNLYRVQKLSKVEYGKTSVRDYVFRHHLETQLIDRKETKGITYKSVKSLAKLNGIVKVRINHLGYIVQVGEY